MAATAYGAGKLYTWNEAKKIADSHAVVDEVSRAPTMRDVGPLLEKGDFETVAKVVGKPVGELPINRVTKALCEPSIGGFTGLVVGTAAVGIAAGCAIEASSHAKRSKARSALEKAQLADISGRER